jgi:hypothetical protein
LMSDYTVRPTTGADPIHPIYPSDMFSASPALPP